jgi:hypothetical protein
MLNTYKISPTVLFVTITALAAGELFSGTGLYFVAIMTATLICIAITYNLLGGLGTFSGILFAAFSLRTIVISQFGKVLLLESASTNLEVPLYTITIYMVFYFFVMLGVFIYGRISITLPKPLELTKGAQSDMLYAISLIIGTTAAIAYAGTAQEHSIALRSFALGFQSLLVFSLVIAVDRQIKNTNGEHSFGMRAFISWMTLIVFAFLRTSRGQTLIPCITYYACCFLRGYRFKRKHYLAAALGVIGFIYIISPVEIYSRYKVVGSTANEKTYEAFRLLFTTPDWKTVTDASSEASESSAGRGTYFDHPGMFILSRLSLIGPDSTMFSACSSGYHYGWTSFKNDILIQVPKYLYKDKPVQDATGFTGRVTGLNPEDVENSYSALSPIADAFGSFGWWGVIAFSFLVMPMVFNYLDSMFDIRKPWGTAILGILLETFSEGSMGGFVAKVIRFPLEILILSYLMGGIVLMIPVRGDREDKSKLKYPNYKVD